MAKNPVEYAEVELGVHSTWTDATARLDALQQALQTEHEAAQAIKQTKDKLADREREIVTQTRGGFHELSDTAWKTKLKELVHDDPASKELRDSLRSHEASHDQAGADVRYHTQGVQLYTARITELGGLLNFYAASRIGATKVELSESTSASLDRLAASLVALENNHS